MILSPAFGPTREGLGLNPTSESIDCIHIIVHIIACTNAGGLDIKKVYGFQLVYLFLPRKKDKHPLLKTQLF